MVAPGSPPACSAKTPLRALDLGILLGPAVYTETPNTHSLRRSQLRPAWRRPAGTKVGRRTGSGPVLHTFVQRRSCLPQGRPARQGPPGSADRRRPPQSSAFSPPPSLSTFPVPGSPPARCSPPTSAGCVPAGLDGRAGSHRKCSPTARD